MKRIPLLIWLLSLSTYGYTTPVLDINHTQEHSIRLGQFKNNDWINPRFGDEKIGNPNSRSVLISPSNELYKDIDTKMRSMKAVIQAQSNEIKELKSRMDVIEKKLNDDEVEK